MATMLSPRTRRALTVVHIVAGVAVIGDVWGLALMHMAASASGSLPVGRAAFRFTSLMVSAGGVPLSLISLVTGLVLAILGGWGLRRPWVLLKLCIQLAIIATGALFIGPVLRQAPGAADLTQSHRTLVMLMAVQGSLLLVATVLAVYKPGGRRRPPRTAADPA
ncbi:hypothetical protein MPTA5024_06565 [Microbispora sp. ATCC PTA-5024]|nr:hypothetical protein MPTA5024_06565 [Microbispora sp. ATCC PTA-5024]